MDHIRRYAVNPEVRMIVVLGEVGGDEEYQIVEAIKSGEIGKEVRTEYSHPPFPSSCLPILLPPTLHPLSLPPSYPYCYRLPFTLSHSLHPTIVAPLSLRMPPVLALLSHPLIPPHISVLSPPPPSCPLLPSPAPLFVERASL